MTCRIIFQHVPPAFFGYVIMKFREDQKSHAPIVPTPTMRTYDKRPNVRHAMVLAILQTPEQLRKRNNDGETVTIERLLTHQMASERKAQRNQNAAGPSGFLSVPAQCSFTGAAMAALCWSEPLADH